MRELFLMSEPAQPHRINLVCIQKKLFAGLISSDSRVDSRTSQHFLHANIDLVEGIVKSFMIEVLLSNRSRVFYEEVTLQPVFF
jgi:hypothetical protein